MDGGNYNIFPDVNEWSFKRKCDKTIVLDVDQTLVCTFEYSDHLKFLDRRDEKDADILERYYSLDNGEFKGVFRPYMREFIKFCFQFFSNVVIWSAGREDYVKLICAKIFRGMNGRPDASFFRQDCVYDSKQNSTKPLQKVCDKLGITMDKIVIVDDLFTNFQPNPNNGILIPQYLPEGPKTPDRIRVNLRREDKCLLKLKEWFTRDEFIDAPDVRLLNKTMIFY